MDHRIFREFCTIAYDRAGIRLGAGKEALVEARIGKRLRALGLAGAREYLDLLLADESGEELVQFLDVISTNFTSFLREPDHFELLATRAQQWAAEGRREVRVWCAASSTGEEPYSLAITLREALAGTGVGFRILATDISTRVLTAARRGVYGDDRLGSLTRQQRRQHFAREPGPAGQEAWTVRPHLRERIVFQRLNLAKPPFPMRGPFEAVFCRNVMIYFDAAVRQRLVAEIERLLGPGDLLCIGHAETLTGLDTSLVALRPSVYARPPAADATTRRRRAGAGGDRDGGGAAADGEAVVPAGCGSGK